MISASLSRLRQELSVPRRCVAVAVMRISLGICVLSIYIFHVRQYAFLWSNRGVIPFTSYLKYKSIDGAFSLYQFSGKGILETAVFAIGAVITMAFILGFRSRVSSVLFWLFTWSLYQRNPFLMDGGDNIIYIMSFFLMFTQCGECLSLDSLFRKDRPKRNAFVSLVHNFSILAMLVQLCLLYATSALFKVEGHMWQDGTAIYYILRTAEFNLSPLAHIVYDSVFAVTTLTYSTIAFEMAWPFLIWFRKVRVFVFLGAVLLHGMIGYLMGLAWFSLAMISVEVIIFDDDQLYGFAKHVTKLAHVSTRLMQKLRAVQVDALDEHTSLKSTSNSSGAR